MYYAFSHMLKRNLNSCAPNLNSDHPGSTVGSGFGTPLTLELPSQAGCLHLLCGFQKFVLITSFSLYWVLVELFWSFTRLFRTGQLLINTALNPFIFYLASSSCFMQKKRHSKELINCKRHEFLLKIRNSYSHTHIYIYFRV